ncbi:hypothetical protein EsDP_00007333 [Epichloe bromicola]|uniref:Uncharacterized protein n=1 Tax=Epichloe bromicola TaxID=79588 RepID=A0ABQ0D0L6_9HYPO
MRFDVQAFRRRCAFAFRVEVHDQDHYFRNCTFYDRNGNMRAHNPQRNGDAQAYFEHLSPWQRKYCFCRRREEEPLCERCKGSPFISFFTDWNAALRRRQRMIDEGAKEVLTVAVWLQDLPGIYDAYSIARALGFQNPRPFKNEVWVHGGISADSYRILAIFSGTKMTEEVALRVNGSTVMVQMPGGFIRGVRTRSHDGVQFRPDATDALREEMQSLTGIIDNAKFLHLARSIGNTPYRSQNNNASPEITWPFGGMCWRAAP